MQRKVKHIVLFLLAMCSATLVALIATPLMSPSPVSAPTTIPDKIREPPKKLANPPSQALGVEAQKDKGKPYAWWACLPIKAIAIVAGVVLIVIVSYAISSKKEIQYDAETQQQWFEAAKTGNIEWLKNLYDQYNTIIDTRDADKNTALIWSALKGHSACVKYLYEKGADIHAKDKKRKTALYYAEQKEHTKIVNYLSEVEEKQDKWLTEASKGNLAYLKSQSDKIHIDAKDNDGDTALILSAAWGHFDCVKYLRQQGANIRLKGQYNKTALEWAESRADDTGSIALIWSASQTDHLACANYLRQQGAK